MRKSVVLFKLYAKKFRASFAKMLDVGAERKEEIYLDISRAATLKDLVYWLQIIFSAGIATLGLVLSSPAVIIGAMLISPLMGPILSGGLALATGDLVLAFRSIVNLSLSCLVAISFSVLLVALIPFKEMTSEIAARTQPNTLDLGIALFSGAIGSVAICREVKGVVTSIPGVAIAVALMPPLCVVGYGIGVALSFDATMGLRAAVGGGLLFLTNLVAITFTAMIVFVALHIDIPQVKKRAAEWRDRDKESAFVQRILHRIPSLEKAEQLRSLPLRLLMILLPLAIIFIPLTRSFSQLSAEIVQKRNENLIRQKATDIWQKNYGKLPNGESRSTIDQLSVNEVDGKLNVFLRVVDTQPYTPTEKAEYTRILAYALDRGIETINLQLVEIPTTTALLAGRPKEEKKETPLTVAQLHANFLQGVETSLSGLRLPPPAQLITKRITSTNEQPLLIELIYLSDREIGTDAQALMLEDIRLRLSFPNALVGYVRIAPEAGTIDFVSNQTALLNGSTNTLNSVGTMLATYNRLVLELTIKKQANEREGISEERAEVVLQYLKSNWSISQDRIKIITTQNGSEKALLKFQLSDSKK